jgi:hypothetical protein
VKHKHILGAVVLTYLILSFIPQLGLMSLLGKAKGKGKGGPS